MKKTIDPLLTVDDYPLYSNSDCQNHKNLLLP